GLGHYPVGHPGVRLLPGADRSLPAVLTFVVGALARCARLGSAAGYALNRAKTFFGTSSKILFLSWSLSEEMPSITGFRSSSILPDAGSRYEPVPGFSVPNMHRSLPTMRTNSSIASELYSAACGVDQRWDIHLHHLFVQ